MWEIHCHIGMGSDQIVAALVGEEVEEREGAGAAEVVRSIAELRDDRRALQALAS